MHSDAFWSYFAMPIGVLICFGPAVAVGLLSARKSGGEGDSGKKD